MTDLQKILFSCPSFDQFSKVLNNVRKALPPEIGEQLIEIVKNYAVRYGLQGTYERLNDRSISQILVQYQSEDVKPIASGEIAGIRYCLYDAPSPKSPKGENAVDQ
jgi:hypothetical protein